MEPERIKQIKPAIMDAIDSLPESCLACHKRFFCNFNEKCTKCESRKILSELLKDFD